MDRQGAGDVFSGWRRARAARMRRPAGVAASEKTAAAKKNGDDNNGTDCSPAGADGFAAITALMRLAQRRA
jgi:hypothetical protein